MKKLIIKGFIILAAGLTSFITGMGIGLAFDAIDQDLDSEKAD